MSLDDIGSIAEYISRDSLHHAQQVIEQVFELGDSLPEQPESGSAVSELNDSQVRERFIYSYRLIYEIKDNDIHIMGLIQGKRLLKSVKRFDTDYTLAAVTVALPEQPVRHLTLNVSFILPSCTYRS